MVVPFRVKNKYAVGLRVSWPFASWRSIGHSVARWCRDDLAPLMDMTEVKKHGIDHGTAIWRWDHAQAVRVLVLVAPGLWNCGQTGWLAKSGWTFPRPIPFQTWIWRINLWGWSRCQGPHTTAFGVNCIQRMPNKEKLAKWSCYPLLKVHVAATRTSQLDGFVELEVSSGVKSADRELSENDWKWMVHRQEIRWRCFFLLMKWILQSEKCLLGCQFLWLTLTIHSAVRLGLAGMW